MHNSQCCGKRGCSLAMTAKTLVVIGGINWGLVGVLKLDLVETIFGSIAILQQIIYIVIGLAALYMVYGTLMKK